MKPTIAGISVALIVSAAVFGIYVWQMDDDMAPMSSELEPVLWGGPPTTNPPPARKSKQTNAMNDWQGQVDSLTAYGATVKRPDAIVVPINESMTPDLQSNLWRRVHARQAAAVEQFAEYIERQNALQESKP